MKKMLKMLGIFASALILVAGFAGCSSDPAPAKYKITYKTAYGTTPAEKTVESGTKLTAADLPVLTAANVTEEGKTYKLTFNNWYDETDTAKKAVAANFKVTKKLTLVADWTKEVTDSTPEGPEPEPGTKVKCEVCEAEYDTAEDAAACAETGLCPGYKATKPVSASWTFSSKADASSSNIGATLTPSDIAEITYDSAMKISASGSGKEYEVAKIKLEDTATVTITAKYAGDYDATKIRSLSFEGESKAMTADTTKKDITISKKLAAGEYVIKASGVNITKIAAVNDVPYEPELAAGTYYWTFADLDLDTLKEKMSLSSKDGAGFSVADKNSNLEHLRVYFKENESYEYASTPAGLKMVLSNGNIDNTTLTTVDGSFNRIAPSKSADSLATAYDEMGAAGKALGCVENVSAECVSVNVKGPFTVNVFYGSNGNSAKTDRKTQIKINGEVKVESEQNIPVDGAWLTYKYTGTDSVTVNVGAEKIMRLYEVQIVKE